MDLFTTNGESEKRTCVKRRHDIKPLLNPSKQQKDGVVFPNR